MEKRRTVLVVVLLLFLAGLAHSQEASEDGIHQEYYDSGNVHYERNYRNGQKDGLAREYYEDGTIKIEVMYVKGKKQGVFKEYYPTGILKATFELKDNIQNGVVEKYYEDGKLQHSSLYENGMPNSKGVKQFQYFDDGSLKYEYYYDKDEGGSSKTYYKNGQVSLETIIKGWGSYECKNYDEEGNFVSTECPEK